MRFVAKMQNNISSLVLQQNSQHKQLDQYQSPYAEVQNIPLHRAVISSSSVLHSVCQPVLGHALRSCDLLPSGIANLCTSFRIGVGS